MYKVVSVTLMRDIEAAAEAAGLPSSMLMENAGRATAERVKQLLAQQDGADTKVTVLVGPGNNGGDALVAGRFLAEETTAQVRFYFYKPRDENDALFQAVKNLGVFMADAKSDQRYRVLVNLVASATFILDGLFGIGVRLPLRDDAAKLLRAIKQGLNEGSDQQNDGVSCLYRPVHNESTSPIRPYVLALDCPSGLNCDTGELDSNTIYADETITYIAAKPGLFQFPGAAAVGKLTLSSLGVPANSPVLKDVSAFVAGGSEVQGALPSRPLNSNKGTFGKALIIGGSANYLGAPALAATAAYRSGAGLVSIGAPSSIVPVIASGIPEATWLMLPHELGLLTADAAALIRDAAARYQSMLIGVGMGNEKETRDFLMTLLKSDKAPKPRSGIGFTSASTSETNSEDKGKLPPLVLDADALNILSQLERWWEQLPPNTIITPHPGEMGRLAGISTDAVQTSRLAIAQEKARLWNVVLVLKGAHTIVASPEGDTAILPFKISSLAKAGTGDVLAGVITGLLAQGLTPFAAAWSGAYLHGLAGELAAEQLGERAVVATDVIEALARAFRSLG